MVSGRARMLIANDATVKGGTYYGITCKKHVRAQKFAWQHRLPCVTMVQSGGANPPDQPNIFPDDGQFGSIFYNQIRMSSEGIAQIAIVHGPSTAGGAYMPALCDETVIIRNQGAMFWADHNWSMPRPRKRSASKRSAAVKCTAASAASPTIWRGKRQPRDRDYPRYRRQSR